MTYSVKSIFSTIQGEGAKVGSPAVFCRFTGCNLWSGREEDRSSAVCTFCDTDFVGTDGESGGKFKSADDLAQAVRAKWSEPSSSNHPPLVVVTGGEPLLQLDEDLVHAFHKVGMKVAVETNGTILPPTELDWLCVSPKFGADLIVHSGDELKLIYPQKGIDPESYLGLDFTNYFLQPMDGPHLEENTKKTVQYCQDHPEWRVSIQAHKILGIP